MDAKQTNQLQPQVQTAYEKLTTNLIFKRKKKKSFVGESSLESVCVHMHRNNWSPEANFWCHLIHLESTYVTISHGWKRIDLRSSWLSSKHFTGYVILPAILLHWLYQGFRLYIYLIHLFINTYKITRCV